MEESGKQLCEAARNGDTEKLKTLIDSGADVSFFDGEGLAPLMHAAKLGHADAVKILLEAGAPWNALNPSNLSAGDLAMEASHEEAYELLLNDPSSGSETQSAPSLFEPKNSASLLLNPAMAIGRVPSGNPIRARAQRWF